MQNDAKVLVRYEDFGSIVRCENGCVYVQLGFTVMTLTEPQFMQFVAMVSESAANLELARASADQGGARGAGWEDSPESY